MKKNNKNINTNNNYQADYKLIAKIKEGDEKAFEELMNKYYNNVFHTIKRLVKNEQDAEDLTLEVFAKIYYNIDMFIPYSSFNRWLLRTASNYAIDFLRKKKMKDVSETVNKDDTNIIDLMGSEELNPEENLIKQQQLESLQRIIDELPPKDKEIIKLRFFGDLSYKDIAKKLNVPIGTVKARLHRAKKLLLVLIKKKTK